MPYTYSFEGPRPKTMHHNQVSNIFLFEEMYVDRNSRIVVPPQWWPNSFTIQAISLLRFVSSALCSYTLFLCF